jgi:hypothetical protein
LYILAANPCQLITAKLFTTPTTKITFKMEHAAACSVAAQACSWTVIKMEHRAPCSVLKVIFFVDTSVYSSS